MVQRKSGSFENISTAGGETCRAFIPNPLPPIPPLNIDTELKALEEKALLSLGRLDSVSTLLPDTSLFLYMYIRKEAVLSSQIEGTQSSLSDLLLWETEALPGVPVDDVQEVSNYVAAINHGLKRLRKGFPISLRLLKEIHAVLLSKGRGSDKTPGEFRTSQNWIGGTRPGNAIYIPPSPEKVVETMGALEKFLHNDPVRTPILQKLALAHVQFESIHPFLDGNGRLGRLMITLLLCAEEALSQPLLYLSLYFKTNRTQYYDLLQGVRVNGEWEAWLHFFLTGVHETSAQAVTTAQRLVKMFTRDRDKIAGLGRASGSALRVHDTLQRTPILSIAKAAKISKLSIPTATTAIGHLESLGLVREIRGRKRGKLYGYSEYVRILNQGTQPLS
ncbi:MAG: Fic family protein [Candidatus Zixiibacteriota bacterium]